MLDSVIVKKGVKARVAGQATLSGTWFASGFRGASFNTKNSGKRKNGVSGCRSIRILREKPEPYVPLATARQSGGGFWGKKTAQVARRKNRGPRNAKIQHLSKDNGGEKRQRGGGKERGG